MGYAIDGESLNLLEENLGGAAVAAHDVDTVGRTVHAEAVQVEELDGAVGFRRDCADAGGDVDPGLTENMQSGGYVGIGMGFGFWGITLVSHTRMREGTRELVRKPFSGIIRDYFRVKTGVGYRLETSS